MHWRPAGSEFDRACRTGGVEAGPQLRSSTVLARIPSASPQRGQGARTEFDAFDVHAARCAQQQSVQML
jgi:hypothetical protein